MIKEELFRTAIKENRDRIYRICNYYFTNEDDRDDAYQESLVRLWQNIGSYRGDSSLSTWIYRVVVNSCLAYMRTDKRRMTIIDTGVNVAHISMADQPAGEDDHIPERKLKFFRSFMELLSNADRTLVSLYLENLSTRDMADVTGFSESNVRVRIHRTKEQIKKEWEEKENGTG